MIEVALKKRTENPIEAIELAASNCYGTIPDNGHIVSQCYQSGHHSVFEFAHFQFHITGISRACSHQLVRYRTGHFAQRSQRYCDEGDFEYVIPRTIQTNANALQAYENFMDICKTAHHQLGKLNIPREDIRYILPNACETIVEVGFDLRNLIHFCNERLCLRAQWEIREVAKKMVEQVLNIEPRFKSMLVPKCERHDKYPFCTERNGCGKHKKLEEVYKNNEY